MPEDDIVEDVSVSQMPWMVTLGGFKTINNWIHQCGGSLVTSKHVLTSAHCYEIMTRAEEYIRGPQMRLGISDFWDARSGITRKIIEFLIHPRFQDNAYFDAGVAVSDQLISYTPKIRPICLPMRPVDDVDAYAEDFVNLAGWGLKYDRVSKQYKAKSGLKLVNLQVNPKDICEDIYSPENLKNLNIPEFRLRQQLPNGFTRTVTCVGNDFDFEEGSCEGDSGSPVIRRVSETSRKEPYFEQAFIVSTGLDCKLKATIYTRIGERNILSWIQKVTNTEPLIMVAGGYVGPQYSASNLTNKVELIGAKYDRQCSKAINTIIGNGYNGDLDGRQFTFNDGEIIGSTGQYVKDAAVVCGGKGILGNSNRCYEYHPVLSR